MLTDINLQWVDMKLGCRFKGQRDRRVEQHSVLKLAFSVIVKIDCGNQWFVCSSSRELRFCLYVSSLHNCEIQHQAALPCSGTMLCCSKLPTPAGSPLCNSGCCCCCRCCTKNNWHLAIVGDTAQLRWAAPFRGIWKHLPRPDLKLKSTYLLEKFSML